MTAIRALIEGEIRKKQTKRNRLQYEVIKLEAEIEELRNKLIEEA